MILDKLEHYWSAELGEPVEINLQGWDDHPGEYALYISGTNVVAFKHLEDLEDWLERYVMVQGEETVG